MPLNFMNYVFVVVSFLVVAGLFFTGPGDKIVQFVFPTAKTEDLIHGRPLMARFLQVPEKRPQEESLIKLTNHAGKFLSLSNDELTLRYFDSLGEIVAVNLDDYQRTGQASFKKLMSAGKNIDEVYWFSDGNSALIKRANHYFLLSLEPPNLKQIIFPTGVFSLSPNGSKTVYFLSDSQPGWGTIEVFYLASGKRKELMKTRSVNWKMGWMGENKVFLESTDNPGTIFALDPEGNGLEKIFQGDHTPFGADQWSSDGRYLFYSASDSSSEEYFIFDRISFEQIPVGSISGECSWRKSQARLICNESGVVSELIVDGLAVKRKEIYRDSAGLLDGKGVDFVFSRSLGYFIFPQKEKGVLFVEKTTIK